MDANADAEGSTIALCEPCSGKLKMDLNTRVVTNVDRWTQIPVSYLLALTLSSLSRSDPLFQKKNSVKNQNRIANSVDPDETTQYEPSHQDLANSVDPDETAQYEPSRQDLHCLQKSVLVLKPRTERVN